MYVAFIFSIDFLASSTNRGGTRNTVQAEDRLGIYTRLNRGDYEYLRKNRRSTVWHNRSG